MLQYIDMHMHTSYNILLALLANRLTGNILLPSFMKILIEHNIHVYVKEQFWETTKEVLATVREYMA
jgi:hypothetical protein